MILLAWSVVVFAQVAPPVDGTVDKEKAAIEGTVVSATTGSPLRKAQVTVTLEDARNGIATTTDDKGKFALDNLEPGVYYVEAERFGYLKSDHAAPLEISAGQRVKDFVVKLTPQGIIAGRVVDEDGDPVPDMEASIERFADMGRKHPLESEGSIVDGEGAFKFTGLQTGPLFFIHRAATGTGSNRRRGDADPNILSRCDRLNRRTADHACAGRRSSRC